MFEVIKDVLAVLGGVGIIVIGLSKFLGGILRDRLRENTRRQAKIEIETHRQRLYNRRAQADQYAQSQYDVYVELWKTIQGLKLAVDSLWEEAAPQNIASLAHALRDSRLKIDNWSIFFVEQHLNRLNDLLRTLERFEEGKMHLVDIRSSQDVSRRFREEIAFQIKQNKEYKKKFEELLKELRVTFRNKLSQVEYEGESA